MHADLLLRWGVAAGDVDAKTIYEWLVEGAPAGIAQKVYDPGVFPPSDLQDPELDYFERPDESLHTNYVSVDNDPDAEPEVRRLLESNFVEVFDSLEEAQSWAGGRLHLSKLAMITKEKDGRIKRRLIMDCRRSSVNDMAARGGKLVLPRISDVVDDLLYLLDQMSDAEDISMEMMVLDFSDWFFLSDTACPCREQALRLFLQRKVRRLHDSTTRVSECARSLRASCCFSGKTHARSTSCTTSAATDFRRRSVHLRHRTWT